MNRAKIEIYKDGVLIGKCNSLPKVLEWLGVHDELLGGTGLTFLSPGEHECGYPDFRRDCFQCMTQ